MYRELSVIQVRKAMKLITIICTLIGFAFGLAENIIVGNQIQSYKRQQRRKNRDKLIHRAVLQVYSLPAEYRTQALAELQVFMDRLQKRREEAEAEKKIEEEIQKRRNRFQSHHLRDY